MISCTCQLRVQEPTFEELNALLGTNTGPKQYLVPTPDVW